MRLCNKKLAIDGNSVILRNYTKHKLCLGNGMYPLVVYISSLRFSYTELGTFLYMYGCDYTLNSMDIVGMESIWDYLTKDLLLMVNV